MVYANEMGIKIEITNESFKVTDKNNNSEINKVEQLKVTLRKNREAKYDETLDSCT